MKGIIKSILERGRKLYPITRSRAVVCEDGTLADCLSTAMFVLGVNGALRYWRNYGGFDMVMITDENEVICTSGLVEVFELTNTKDYTSRFTE